MTTTPPERTSAPKRRSRDGLFQRRGWWWIDYYDAEGRRHRKKAAPDYETAKRVYRDRMGAIARGEVLGVRDEDLRFAAFLERRYWPTVKPTLTPAEQARAEGILTAQLVPRFGGWRVARLPREEIDRWFSDRLAAVKPSTANKELSRLKHALTRAVAWGYLRASPARGLKPARAPQGRVRYLTPEEQVLLLDGHDVEIKARDGRRWIAHRGPTPTLRTYIVAALQTGARRGELVSLR